MNAETSRSSKHSRSAPCKRATRRSRQLAREKLGDLYNPNDYPAEVQTRFKVEWEYPPLDPPIYLATVNPALYEQEQEKLRTRFAEAANIAEEAFITEFANLTAHLADRLQPEPDGTQKIFHATAIDNLKQFFDRFSKLNLTGNQKIEDLIEEARKVVTGITPKEIRDMETLRGEVRGSMETLTAKLDAMLVNKPKRKIAQLKKPEESNADVKRLFFQPDGRVQLLHDDDTLDFLFRAEIGTAHHTPSIKRGAHD